MSAMKPPDHVADFDSASAMMRATARFLSGRDFPMLGVRSPLAPFVPVIRRLPRRALDLLYTVSGAAEAVPPERLRDLRAEALSEWVASEYPRRRYPAVFIGSSNGALVHLAAALDAPFLPQTFLVAVRRTGIDPDDAISDLEWGRQPARWLLDGNPDLQLHHMHDPNQDRLMIRRMTYFRVKRRALGAAYRRFLEERLAPGGTVFLVDCRVRWPVHRVGPRHVFQPGAMGGLGPEEYLRGSPAVAEHLRRYRSHARRWSVPEIDDEAPEAEWGFEPAIVEDVASLARERGFRVRRLVFDAPEDLSPLVADLHRWWYRRRGIEPRRLVSGSFIVLEPWWTLATGSVPWWCKFAVEPSARRLESYLDDREPFDEIGLMLFSHGMRGAGFAPIERWRGILRRARVRGRFIGVDEERFPLDFASFKRYHDDMRALEPRHPMPPPLPLEDLDRFLEEHDGRHAVRWTTMRGPERAEREPEGAGRA